MSNGPDTHEWRLEQLEAWRSVMDRMIWRGLLALVANLIGVVILLGLEILRRVGGQ